MNIHPTDIAYRAVFSRKLTQHRAAGESSADGSVVHDPRPIKPFARLPTALAYPPKKKCFFKHTDN